MPIGMPTEGHVGGNREALNYPVVFVALGLNWPLSAFRRLGGG